MLERIVSPLTGGNGQRLELTPSHPEGSGGSNPPCRIRLIQCKDSGEFASFRNLINTHHTYKPWKRSPGRKICWLIETNGSEPLGAIAVHSAVLSIKARDDYIGWTFGTDCCIATLAPLRRLLSRWSSAPSSSCLQVIPGSEFGQWVGVVDICARFYAQY